jgi:Nuclease-related domain
MAGASAYARYRAMRATQRQERAVVRLALSGVAGSMTAGLFGWLPGASVAVAVMLVHAIYLRVRPDATARWRRGAAAERRTGRRLARLDPACFHVLHDRALPGVRRSNLDHLVIGHTGVYAVASRRWPFYLRLRAGPRPVTRLLAMTRHAARVVSDCLTDELGQHVRVSPIIAVHGPRLPPSGLRFGGVTLQGANRTHRLIERQPVVYTTAQVSTIAAAAERVLRPMIEL